VYFFGGFTLLDFGRTICLVVTCEGGNLSLSHNPLPLQNPRSPWTSPLGLTTLKRKNHPIVVTLGGIGSCYASLIFKPQAFILATNCAITHFIQRKEEEIKETSCKHSKTRRIQVIREKTCERYSASDVTSMDTLRETEERKTICFHC
jgi:hypothetical protein